MRPPLRSLRRHGSRMQRDTARAQPSPRDRRRSLAQLRTRTPKERGPTVLRGVVNHLAKEVAEDVAEVRSRIEPELDQIVAVHREIREPVRMLALPFQALPELVELLDVSERQSCDLG